MANRGEIIGGLVAVRNTDDAPSLSSMDWTVCLVTDSSLLPKAGVDGDDGDKGDKGDKGDSIKGDKGDKGEPGRNGVDADQIIPSGLWKRNRDYPRLALVGYENDSYIASEPNKNKVPGVSAVWQLIAKSIVGERGKQGEQGGAGQRGRSSIALQNELVERVEALETEIQSIDVESVPALFVYSTSKGMAISLDTDGNARLASAAPIESYTAVKYNSCDGFALADTPAGETGSYITDGILELDDWSAVTGTVHLSPGKYYTLSETEPGKLTERGTVGPYLIVQQIGIALNEHQLSIEIETGSFSIKVQVEFDSDSFPAAVVYASSNGHVDKAKSDDLSTAAAVGLGYASPKAGYIGEYYRYGPIIAANKDWTASTGSPELVPGPYWLSDTDAGKMTNVEPTTPGNYRVKLGEAIDSYTFFIKPEQPELIT